MTDGSRRSVARARTASSYLLVLWACTACQEPAAVPIVDQGLEDIAADMVFEGFTNFVTKEGVRTARVQADSARMFRDSLVVRLFGLTLTTFTESGAQRAVILADSGRMHQRSEELVAWGDVALTIVEGARRIETSELHYDPARNRLWSDSATTYREGGRTTRGSCFETDLEFRNRRICEIRGAADIGASPPDSTVGN